jgi:hypothetical protein
MTKSWAWRTSGSITAAAAVIGLSVMMPAGAAQAGPNCSAITGCSLIRNNSAYEIVAIHNWTCDFGTTGTANEGCSGGDSMWVSSGGRTPSNQDWDVIQVDAGWCYKIRFTNWSGSWNVTYDRRGRSATHVKVENGSLGDVVGQSVSGCP